MNLFAIGRKKTGNAQDTKNISEKHQFSVCSLCNSRLFNKLITDVEKNGKSYNVFFCEHCKTGITADMPSFDELSNLYSSGNYRSDTGRRFVSLMEFLVYIFRLKRKKRIKKYIKKGTLLDIGCGRGLFLDIMKKDNWTVAGTEFNKKTASHASELYSVNVVTGNPSEWGFQDGSFDVITANHVLEHIYKPKEIIAKSKGLLKKSGLLVVAVPNILSLQASIGKKAWLHLDIPYHLHHFSAEGLCSLLNKHSFRVVEVRHFDMEYNPFGWLQTLLNLSGIRENLLYNILKSPEIRSKEFSAATKKDLILTFAFLPLYSFISFFLSVTEAFILKRGGTIEVYAIKE